MSVVRSHLDCQVFSYPIIKLVVFYRSQLSPHSSATAGLAMSLKDGSINLSNLWTRQLSETSNGNVYLSFLNNTLKDRRKSCIGDICLPLLWIHMLVVIISLLISITFISCCLHL